MTYLRAIRGWIISRPKRVVAWLCIVLVVFALTAVLIRAQNSSPAVTQKKPILDGRACTSEGTVFEGITALEDLTAQFSMDIDLVVEERIALYSDASAWSCVPGDEEEPPMPILSAMADALPGWHRTDRAVGSGWIRTKRPVTIAAFSSVLAEYLRAYECRILELQGSALERIARQDDLPEGTTFCCASAGCIPSQEAASCLTPASPDPTCGNTCPMLLTDADLALRVPAYSEGLHEERARARSALERTLWMLRSFEGQWSTLHDLQCLMRASLDLKAEMHLLATATSCLPRIRDAVTSLHDRTPFAP